jgi:MFS transporter, DHA1 family, multidrug resistance protein
MKTPSLFVPFLLICAVLTFEIATDLYVPSLPEMTLHYGVDESITQLTLSAYLLGFSLLGLVSGPLSDSVGRRSVFLLGLLIFASGSASCCFVDSIYGLISARFVQGLGAGISYVVATAIIKDQYPEHVCSRIFSLMGMAVTLSPTIAPIIGGIIANIWGWHITFQVILFCSIATMAFLLLMLPESLPVQSRAPFSMNQILSTYADLARRKEIIGFCLISGITFAGLWAWIAEAPFYFINQLGVKSVEYGYYAAIGPAAYIVGSTINQRFVVYFGVESLLRWGLLVNIIGSLLLLLVAEFYDHSIPAICLALSIYAIGIACVFPNSSTRAVDVPVNQCGSASAILSTVEMSFAASSALLVGYLSNQTLTPPAFIILVCALVCAVLYSWIKGSFRFWRSSPQEPT